MRIAICAAGQDLNSPVEQRFGRSPYFILVDENGRHIETLANSALDSPQGAGIASAQLLVNHRVDTVLVGRVGPKAIQPLQAAGIKIFSGISGTVQESLEMFKQGKLTELDRPNAATRGGGYPGRGGN